MDLQTMNSSYDDVKKLYTNEYSYINDEFSTY